MPKIKIEKVVSFSSEDPVHIANNILSNDPLKKWRCQTVGEKSANIVLQLEEPAVVSNIDIGNEHSAYVEVLVSRSCANEDFKALLVMSSFMSPLEARQSTNINKVRMFSYDQLSDPERDEKWDQIKIVCTQPFNRHVQYGLSFVTFHTSGIDDSKAQKPQIGKFALRPESPSNITIGSLFARKKELQEPLKPLTAAAAIRDASSCPQQSPTSKKIKITQNTSTTQDIDIPNLSRKRDEILYCKDDTVPNDKVDFIIDQKSLEKEKLKQKDTKCKELNGKKPIQKQDENVEPSTSTKNTGRTKRKSESLEKASNKKVKKQPQKPFHQLFGDVIIVISGIQNPDRTNIRNMAVAMGAKYKADWDNTCTHLVCAYPNTPKFNQVKGKGKIVTKTWVTDCHTKRKRLPWRRYALDKSDKQKNESEEEIIEEVKVTRQTSNKGDENRDIKSGSDTEDEIERINTLHQLKDKSDVRSTEEENSKKQSLNNRSSADADTASERTNIFDADTDEEDIKPETNANYPLLPNIFHGKVFYIEKNLSSDERKTLIKYIVACHGTTATSLANDVDYIVTTEEHKLEPDELLTGTKMIHLNYIYECFNSKQIIPDDKYIL